MFYFSFQRQEPYASELDCKSVIEALDPFFASDKTFCQQEGPIQIVQCKHTNTPQSQFENETQTDLIQGDLIASWSRLDNRSELGRVLDVSREDLKRTCDSQLILKAWKRWGGNCVDYLLGDFSFAIYDRRNNSVFCGRDHFGVRPLFYYLSEELFVCASCIPALQLAITPSANINDKWIADYLCRLSMSFDETAFNEIKKIPPGHCLSVTSENKRLRCYFKLSPQPPLLLKDSREYVDAYRAQLEESVRCRLCTDYGIGVEASGGLDSSGITALAARFLKDKPVKLQTFGFINFESEPEYIAALNSFCGLPPTHLFAWQDLDNIHYSAKERAQLLIGHPVEHDSSTFHAPFYSLAQQLNIKTLVSGFGGDEFVTNIHDHLILREMCCKNSLLNLFNRMPGNSTTRLFRLAKMIGRRLMNKPYTKDGYNPYLYRSFNERWPHQPLKKEYVDLYRIKERFYNKAKFDAEYEDLKAFLVEMRWQPFVPTRMENCSLMAASYGIEYRWPLLDVRLINLYLSIPSHESYYKGMGRYLHRRAVEHTIPDVITWNPGKNMGKRVGVDKRQDAALFKKRDELHWKLREILDLEKYQQQKAALMGKHLEHFEKVLYDGNISKIAFLDKWLHAHY